MATSMLKFCCRPATRCKTLFFNQIRTGYVVLLPEIPADTPKTNPLLCTGVVPKFSSLTAEKCSNGVGKLVIEYEAGLFELEKKLLEDPDAKRNFSDIISPLEKLLSPLDFAWSTVRTIYLLNHTEDLEYVYTRLHPRVQKARVQRFQSIPIHKALTELNNDKKNLTEVQQRVVDKYLLEAKLNGIALKDYQLSHFNNTLQTIAKEKNIFRVKLRESTNRFNHVINDYGVVRDFPEDLLTKMSADRTNPSRGPWNLTLHPQIYHPFMQYCSNRKMRHNLWQANNSRASSVNDNVLNNSLQMEEIRFQRRDQAKLLGYPSFAHLSMDTKMAGNLENVNAMITSLQVKSKPSLERELAELQEFALSRGYEGKIELWDVPYFQRKQKQSIIGLDEEELRKHLPFPHVLKELFQLCNSLFGVTIKDATSEIDPWDPHVKYYKVFDETNSEVASFYLDPYYRPQKLLTGPSLECGITRCDVLNVKPTTHLIFNFQSPIHELPSLLTLEDVVSLFQKFGCALQHLLTTVPYCEVSGTTNVEWDAVDVCSNFLSLWLDNVDTLRSLTSHYSTKQQLSEETCANIVKARHNMAAFNLTRQLYLSKLDLEIYESKDFWLDITRRVWPEFIPFTLEKKDAHPCSFSEIFSDEFPAAYYSSTWAEMIAADVFSAFEEVGLDNVTEIQEKGKRFRNTFLALGGGCHPSEVFRRFRGRDPSPDALLKHYEIIK